MAKVDDETISFRASVRGSKDLWTTFVNKVRENRRKVDKNLTTWMVLEKFIREYIKQ